MSQGKNQLVSLLTINKNPEMKFSVLGYLTFNFSKLSGKGKLKNQRVETGI